MLRVVTICCLILMLSACAAGEELIEKGMRLQFINSYAELKHDFNRGRIMRARAIALAMEKDHQDYAAAQNFLKKKIEPARRRIFVHYLRSAKRFEQRKQWAEAMEAYAQAKSVTIKPEVMEAKRSQMEFRMRQLRFDRLLTQRRAEDAEWLAGLRSYEPTRGVSPKDEVYARQREVYNEALDERADERYSEAKRYMRRKIPEIAYVEVESHLRLQPGSGKGERLLAEIRQAMPAELKVKPLHTSDGAKNKASSGRGKPDEVVTAAGIQTAIKQGELLKARHMVQSYRRVDGKDAEKLSAQIDKKIEARAADLFAKGSIAFRQEKLDRAINFWSESVALMPEKAEYVEALHRARQLKERLNLLRSQKESDPIPDEE